MKKYPGSSTVLAACSLIAAGCSVTEPVSPYVPSLRYSGQPGVATSGYAQNARGDSPYLSPAEHANHDNAQLRLVDGDLRHSQEQYPSSPRILDGRNTSDGRGDLADGASGNVEVYRSRELMKAAYRGPLSLGEPGVTSSLWRESRGGNDIFRDARAWQPMDILTIVVTERSRGAHDADTELKSQTILEAAIENLLGFETKALKQNPPIDVSSVVSATTINNFKGEGTTTRTGELTARISAVVAEVLPSGLLRIEGEKIISVNNEEQVMVISGLVRNRDISSINEVDSSKIAQLRIDYYGQGEVGSVQRSGWLSKLMRYIWPF